MNLFSISIRHVASFLPAVAVATLPCGLLARSVVLGDVRVSSSPVAAAGQSAPVPVPSGTSGLRTVPLPGQVALSWKEQGGRPRTVLVSDQPIDESNRSVAAIVAEDVLPGSANDWFEDPAETPRARGPVRGWLLEPGGHPLPAEDGMLVYTFRRNDPAALYFAVVAPGETVEPGRNATVEPVAARVGIPVPIVQSQQAAEAMRNAPKGLPVVLYLHPHTSRPNGELTHLLFGDPEMGWRDGLPFKFKVEVGKDHIRIEPYDRVWINRRLSRGETASSYDLKGRNIETFWYGTNDRIHLAGERKDGVAVNYTERWLLHVLDWVIQNYSADADRVYATGVSMGSGVQGLALANPDRFASVDVLVPFVDWSYVQGEENLARRLRGACGPMEMPTNEGITLGERLNLVRVVSEAEGDLPFMVLRTGRNDKSVFWRRKPAYFHAMNEGRHGILASWDQGDHITAGRGVVPGFPAFGDIGWYTQRFALNRSYPAISDSSLNEDYGSGEPDSGSPVGFINRGIDWEVLADEPGLYKVRFFCALPNVDFPVTFTVTPRRLQGFSPSQGREVLIRNTDATGKIISESRLAVSDNGTVIVPDFSITSKEGNTLTLQNIRYVSLP